MVELLICNQRVGGSNPSVGSNFINRLIIKFPFSPTIFPLPGGIGFALAGSSRLPTDD